MKTFWAMKKECATCEYWDGPRIIQSDPRVVECENGYTVGICNGTSHYRGKQVIAGLKCGAKCYKRWHCLKE